MQKGVETGLRRSEVSRLFTSGTVVLSPMRLTSNSTAYLCTVLGLGYSNQEFQHRLRLGNQGSYCVDNGSECGKRLQTWSEEIRVQEKTKLVWLVQIKGLWRWKKLSALNANLAMFFFGHLLLPQIPDASQEITLPFNSHTLQNSRLQHYHCLFLLAIATDVLQSLLFIQFASQIILTSGLFNQMSFLTLALFCYLALDAWSLLQIISTTSRGLLSFLSSITAFVRFLLFLGRSPSTCICNYFLSW